MMMMMVYDQTDQNNNRKIRRNNNNGKFKIEGFLYGWKFQCHETNKLNQKSAGVPKIIMRFIDIWLTML